MSVRAYLSRDYSNIDGYEDMRCVILNRQSQDIIIAKQAADEGDDIKYACAMARIATYEVVLNDIAVAIQREQGR